MEISNKELINQYTRYAQVDWIKVSKHKYLSEDFIRKYKDKLHWHEIVTYQKLSNNFIIESIEKIKWDGILYSASRYQNLSEDVIMMFLSLNLDLLREVTEYQNLSEEFIIRFKSQIDIFDCWDNVSKYQKLSLKFIKDNLDHLNIKALLKNKKLSSYIKYKIKTFSQVL